MDKKTAKFQQELKEFKSQLGGKIPIKKMKLFGSRARGKYHRWSDVDLIVISKKFKGKPFRERARGFYKFWNLKHPVDFICYTPEEYNKMRKSSSVIKEADEEGIDI